MQAMYDSKQGLNKTNVPLSFEVFQSFWEYDDNDDDQCHWMTHCFEVIGL